MKHKILLIYAWLIRTLLFFFPDIPLLMRFRGFLYGLAMKKCGRNFQIAHSAIINGLDLCCFGHDVYIANSCNIILNGELMIGDEVIFGPGVLVSTGNHRFDGKSYRFVESEMSAVSIGRGSWIGGNSTLLGGATVPERSVIGAGSVVTQKSCQSIEGIYVGIPAKLIKQNQKEVCYQ
jgi:maltose O-acetyltransferase